MRINSNNESYEDVSYITEAKYIPQRHNVPKNIKCFCKKQIFKKLVLKLTKEYLVSVKNRLIKQVNDCEIRDLISLDFSNICVSKMREHIVAPIKPNFIKDA